MSYESTKSDRSRSKTLRELGLIASITILIFALTFVFKPFEALAGWSQAYEKWEIDEFLSALVILAIAFGVYSLCKGRELRQEITDR